MANSSPTGPAPSHGSTAPVEWRVDPWTSATIRWGCLLQVALADAGLLLAGLGVLVAFAFWMGAIGAVAVLVVLAVLVYARNRFVVPLERWRWHGAVSRLDAGAVLVALAAGTVAYLLAFWVVGVAVLWLVAVVVLATGAVSGIVGDGVASGRIDPDGDRVVFAGRGRSLDRVASYRRLRVGDLVLFRLRGPGALDDLTWLPVPADRADGVAAALDGAAVSSGAGAEPPSSPVGALTWRRLSTPWLAMAIVGIAVAAVAAGWWATRPETAAPAAPLAVIGVGAGLVAGAVAIHLARG